MIDKVCAVFIIFNPEEEVLQNILNVLPQVEKVYVVDNSPNENFVSQILDFIRSGKIEYYSYKSNIGMAKALNKAVSVAFAAGFDSILTMDQDSCFPPGGIKMMSQSINMPSKDVLLISPIHLGKYGTYDNNLKNVKIKRNLYEVTTTMTSGNLVDIRNLLRIGGYAEDYFIDYLDHEVCLRGNSFGLRNYATGEVVMRHNLGNIDKEYRFLGMKFAPTNHSYIRRYYIARNRLKVYRKYMFKYPNWCIRDAGKFVKELLAIALFEDKKAMKLIYTLKGMFHFSMSISGKLSDE